MKYEYKELDPYAYKARQNEVEFVALKPTGWVIARTPKKGFWDRLAHRLFAWAMESER